MTGQPSAVSYFAWLLLSILNLVGTGVAAHPSRSNIFSLELFPKS